MKTIQIITAVVLFTGLTSLSFAGPGPDYTARMNDAAKRAYQGRWAASNVTAPAKAKPATEVAASCATCGCPSMKKS